MKLSTFKRITKENLPEEHRDLADSIGGSINDFCAEISNGFNKNITVDDNLNMEYKTIQITLNSDNTPSSSTQFKTVLTSRVRGISVEKADNLTNSTGYPTSGPFITYSQNNQIITIQHITGLLPNNKYNITILVKG